VREKNIAHCRDSSKSLAAHVVCIFFFVGILADVVLYSYSTGRAHGTVYS
jgi:hypothetical protein